MLIFREYSAGVANSWAVRVWWTSYFILSSLSLQGQMRQVTELAYQFEISISFIQTAFGGVLAVIGLFFNIKPTPQYEVLEEEKDQLDVTDEERQLNEKKVTISLEEYVYSFLEWVLEWRDWSRIFFETIFQFCESTFASWI